MPLQADAIGDFLVHTLKELGRGSFNDLVSQYPEYVFFKDVLRAKQKAEEGGYGVQRNMMVGTSNNAAWTGLYATETTSVSDVLKTITVPHRIAKTSWSVDEIELDMNSGSFEKIVDIMIERRAGADIDLANLVEAGGWSKPADSTDTGLPFGFPYWLVYNATTGFNGGNPSGFSAGPGGLDSSTYAKWKNYTAQFTAYTEGDLLDTLRTAMDKTNFMPPTEIPEYSTGFDWCLYTTLTNKNECIKLARSQNENLGAELLLFKGVPVFGGFPMKWVPAFEDTTIINASSEPFYGVNWRTFEMTGLKGWTNRESPPMRPYNQPTVRIMYKHMIMNMLCNNRRKNFLVAKAEPTP